MPETLHLLIPDASPLRPEGAALPALPPLPHLDALLRRLRVSDTLTCDDDAPDTPFERALARAHGLPGAPGQVPWAAFDTATFGTPCAWLRPCHWQLGMDHVTLLPPEQLTLPEAESRALLGTVQPLLHEDGLTLEYQRPDAWLAQGELLRGLTTWSMARAAQQPLTREALSLAATPAQSAHLRRLQNELQMLLYTHPVNDAREQRRQPPVNALWIEGAGTLDRPIAPQPGVRVDARLAPAATPDLAAWQAAWQAIDTGSVAQLARELAQGADVRLTLCGPRRAVTLRPGAGLGFRASSFIKPLRWSDLRRQLLLPG
ncbi:MAG: phosphoglycerate mutase [Pseudomonadota bacterium]|nr:phosphoglycerate mutase [Pseudomonadota bacterium]